MAVDVCLSQWFFLLVEYYYYCMKPQSFIDIPKRQKYHQVSQHSAQWKTTEAAAYICAAAVCALTF